MMNEKTAQHDEDTSEATLMRRRALDDYAKKLEKPKEEAVRWRGPFEQRFIDADEQFQSGFVNIKEARETRGKQKRGPHQLSPDNITRSKTKIITSRVQDMLFPTSQPNWSLECSPEATVAPAITQMMPQANQAVANVQTIADERARNMEKRIQDRLAECEYHKAGRQAIEDANKYGTGVIFGPFPQARKRTVKVQNAMVVDLAVNASCEVVDPWDFFPQPCRTIEEADHTFRLKLMTKKQVKSLATQPGFDKDQLRAILKEEPQMGAMSSSPVYARSNGDGGDASTIKGRYQMWRYYGPVPRKVLELMLQCCGAKPGQSVEDFYGFDDCEDEDDPLVSFMGEVWFCNGKVCRAVPLPVQDEDRVPFYVYNYEKDPTSPFGYGIPWVLKNDQHGANIALSAAMLNAMMASGLTGGYLKGALEDEEGGDVQIDLTSPQLFAINPNVADDIRKILQFQTVPSTIAPSLELYDRMVQNADSHCMMPLAASGEPTTGQQTYGGLVMLMNASNIVQRQAAQMWDDEITVPLIRAFVQYEMSMSDDDNIKGDYDVLPQAASFLLVKDMRLQHALMLLQWVDNPRWNPLVNEEEAFRMVVNDMSVPADKVLNTPEQAQAKRDQMAQQKSPEQIEQDTRLQIAKLDAEVRRQEIAGNIQREQIQSSANLQVEQMRMRTQAMKLASDEKVALADIMKEMRIADLDVQTDRMQKEMAEASKERIAALYSQDERLKAGMKAELEAQKLADQKENRALQLKVETPVRLAG